MMAITISLSTLFLLLESNNGNRLSAAEGQIIAQAFRAMPGTDDPGRKFYNHPLRGYDGHAEFSLNRVAIIPMVIDPK